MILAGAGITWGVYATERASREARFDSVLLETAQLVETRVEQYIALLTATRAFLETRSDLPDRGSFAAFVRGLGLEDAYSGLQGIGFALIVQSGAEGEAEDGLAQQYGTPLQIWPEPVSSLRTAIVLLEPGDARNLAAIGYDMFTEERRRAAMRLALETGVAAATAPLTLVQEITANQQTGVLIYLPPSGAADPEVRGFTYSPIRMGDFFDAALAGYDFPLELRVTDTADPTPPLFETPGFEPPQGLGRVRSSTTLSVAGREWRLDALATPAFTAAERPRYTLLSGLAFALLAVAIAAAVQSQSTAIRRARALNEAVQRNVREKDFLLREMSHRMKNALSRTIAIARQSAREAKTKEDLVESLSARLRSMAAAQDLLVRSGTDSADLADLLKSELEQIYGEATKPGLVSGPPVQLDPRQAQALGLVFHELATNALKYGAGSQAGGELRVTWSTHPGPSGRELRLTWKEQTPDPVAADDTPAPSGFGARMIDACVAELSGSLSRRPHEHGLTVELSIPLD